MVEWLLWVVCRPWTRLLGWVGSRHHFLTSALCHEADVAAQREATRLRTMAWR